MHCQTKARGLWVCSIVLYGRYKLGLWCSTVLKSWGCFGFTVLVSHVGQVGGTLVHRSVISGTCYPWHRLSVPHEPCDGATCGAGDTRGPCCRQGDEDRSVAFP